MEIVKFQKCFAEFGNVKLKKIQSSLFKFINFKKGRLDFWLNPKGGGDGPKVPAGQEIVCHFSQDHAMVTKNLDFIHKHPN